MVRLVALAMIVSVAIYAGCGEKKSTNAPPEVAKVQAKTPAATPPEEAPTLPETTPDPEPPEAETPEDAPAAKNGDQETTDQLAEPPQESAEEKEADVDQPLATLPVDKKQEAEQVDMSAWPHAYRLFLPTTVGPLIVDVEIRVDDELLSEVFDRRIDDVIQEANDDDETDLMWEELFSHVTGKPEQFGGQAGFNRSQYRQMVQRFDRNRNKRPDPEEVARFLFRNSGIDAAFRLIGTDHYREINRSESMLFAAIDSNGDRVLDETELDAAPQSLLQIDPNADQRLDPGEVIVQQDNDPAWDRRRSNRRGGVAMDLEGYVDWSMLSYSIEAFRGPVPFSLAQNPIDRIDGDSDKSISSAEAKELRDGWPDLRLKITFDSASDKPSIDVVWRHPELESLIAVKRSPSDIAVSDQSFTLLASVVDRQANRNRVPREAFDMLDANNDGVLEEDEIPAAASEEFSFEDLDADADGKLTYQEINSAPKSQDQPPIWVAQVRARAAEFPDGVFAWLDANHDQFLSTQELLTADKRLRQCSVDQQDVKPTDIPDTFAIQFMHADPTQDQQNFGFAGVVASQSSDWPRWAQSMDVNRDGDISQAEFLGSPSQFQLLDSNRDGFIDSSEVAASVE